MNNMKAVVYERFGPPEVLQIKEIKKPVPKAKEVLVKVYATTAHVGDTILRRGKHPDSKFFTIFLHLARGIRKPRRKILGMELAGEIEAIGEEVTKFKVGDKIFASAYKIMGTYLQYKCLPEDGMIALKPENMSYEEAAAIPNGAITALGNIQKANVKKGQKVLIYGASGSVGTFAVQIAKYYGAEVTGVCSTSNLGWVKELGADKVIDYTKEDYTESGEKYDFVFDAVAKSPKAKRKLAVKEGGVIRSVFQAVKETNENFMLLKTLMDEGKLKAVIDKTYPMEDIVDAHRYVDKGHKKGNVAISISH